MKISARNQFRGKVVSVKRGAVNGIVTLKSDGMDISGTISLAAIDELGLKEGVEAIAIIKATEVMMGKGSLSISARNLFEGTVKEIDKGAVNDIVKLELPSGKIMSSTISDAAVQELGLESGVKAVAIVKATSVLFGVE